MDVSQLANLLNTGKLQQLAGSVGSLKNPYLLFGAVAAVMFVLYGMSVGRTKALVSLLALYVAYTLAVVFPFVDWWSEHVPVAIKPSAPAVLFLALYGVSFFILSYAMAHARRTISEGSLLPLIFISVTQIGLLAAMTASFVAPAFAQRALGAALPFVAGQYALFFWSAGAVLVMLVMRPRSRD